MTKRKSKKRVIKRTTKTAKRAQARKPVARRASRVKFEELSPEAKRVAIAKDVLKQLRAKKILATRGLYMDTELLLTDVEEDDQVCDVLKKVDECRACALGSMFVAAAGLNDKITVGEAKAHYTVTFDVGGDTCYNYLLEFFPRPQLQMMEAVFEGAYGATPYARLKGIMENVVRNNGTYVPPSTILVEAGLSRREFDSEANQA